MQQGRLPTAPHQGRPAGGNCGSGFPARPDIGHCREVVADKARRTENNFAQ